MLKNHPIVIYAAQIVVQMTAALLLHFPGLPGLQRWGLLPLDLRKGDKRGHNGPM